MRFYLLFTIGLLTPVHGFLVPLYIQFTELGLADRWFTLFFPITAFNMPLAIILYENFLSSVPYEVEESAMIDGAKLYQRMTMITPANVQANHFHRDDRGFFVGVE